jgi:hypothetical protein
VQFEPEDVGVYLQRFLEVGYGHPDMVDLTDHRYPLL